MMTLGGQTFAKAYAAIAQALGCAKSTDACGAAGPPSSLAAQPFFEAALGGAGSAYCKNFANCTTAVANKEFDNIATQSVWSMWSDLDKGAFTFARSMMNTPLASTAPCPGSTSTSPCGANGQITGNIALNTSLGYGNYNGAFFTLRTNDWHGITTQQNFTWSKSLGTASVVQSTSSFTLDDPFNIGLQYGPQIFDRKFVYNVFVVYNPPWFKNQPGVLGRLLGGWSLAPVFAAGSGLPIEAFTVNGTGQAFGGADANTYGDIENAIPTASLGSTSHVHYGVCTGASAASCSIGNSGFGLNVFKDPAAAWANLRQPILGLDTKDGGAGFFRGLPYWNMDMSLRKKINITERVNFEFQTTFTNVLNHVVFLDPSLDTSNPSAFGTSGGQANTPRQMEFGLRVNW
jgi:hypothetical protein